MMGSRQWVEHERLETLPFQCRTKQVDITVLPLQLLVRFPLDLGKRFDTSVFFNTRSIADTLFLFDASHARRHRQTQDIGSRSAECVRDKCGIVTHGFRHKRPIDDHPFDEPQ